MAENEEFEKQISLAFLDQIGSMHNFSGTEQAEHGGHDGIRRPANGGAIRPQLCVSLLSLGSLAFMLVRVIAKFCPESKSADLGRGEMLSLRVIDGLGF